MVHAEKNLPRVIGIVHGTPETTEKAKKFVGELPPTSTVALEMDGQCLSAQYPVLAKLGLFGKTFTTLAEHAKKLGHKVIWIERPLSFINSANRTALKELEARAKQLERDGKTPVDAAAELKRHELWKALQSDLSASFWRSKIMAKTIGRKKDWKSTDAALAGAGHAANLCKILGTQAEYLHPFETKQEFDDFLAVALLEQRRADSKYRRARKWNKFIRNFPA